MTTALAVALHAEERFETVEMQDSSLLVGRLVLKPQTDTDLVQEFVEIHLEAVVVEFERHRTCFTHLHPAQDETRSQTHQARLIICRLRRSDGKKKLTLRSKTSDSFTNFEELYYFVQ